MENLISVIIPIYNTREYLPQCLDSVINQTYKNLEIVLVDDGSTDGSGEICDEYAKRDARIKVIHQEKSGATFARKAGVKTARGDYIGFADSDDWIESIMYEHLLGLVVKHDVDFATTGILYEGKDFSEQRYVGREGRYSYHDSGKMCTYKHMYYSDRNSTSCLAPHLYTKLFKRNTVDKFFFSVPDEISICDDQAFVFSCVPFIDSFYVSTEPLYHYRQHQASMMNTVRKDYIHSISLFYHHLKIMFEGHEKSALLMEELDKHYAAMVLRTITKLLPKNVVDELILCHHFPIESLLPSTKIIICGEKAICDSYKRQLNNCENIEVLEIVDWRSIKITKHNYDIVIVATAKYDITETIIKELTEKHKIIPKKIKWKIPKRISDMIIAK